VLAHSGGSWEHPPADLRWNGDMAAARDAILEGLAGGSQGAPWGFKDPRTLLTLEFWRQAAPQARLVGSFRHPVRVVRSLHKRGHGMDMPTGLALWATYNERLLALHASSPFPIVSFDLPAAGYRAAIDALALHLDLPLRCPEADPFFEQQLRTHDDETDDALQASHLALYDALVQASRRWGP